MANFFDQFDAPSSSGNFFDQFDEKPEAPKPERGLIARLKDTGLSFASGATSATKAIADAFGASNAVSDGLQSATESLDAAQSPAYQAQRQQQAQRMRDAEQTGSAWEEMKAGVQNFADSPIEFMAQGAGSIVPTALAALASKRLGISPTRSAGTIGATQGAGAVKGSIYDDQVQRATEAGLTPEQAQAQASAAQSYTGANADQIALGAGLGVLAGTTGVERMLGGGASAIKNRAGRTLAGMATEAVPEAAQGGQERLAANIAAQREGYEAPTWQGVAGQATMEGLASTGPGGLSGFMTPHVDPNAGPLSRAAATAQQTGAAGLAQAAQQAQAAEGDTQAAQPDADPLAGLSARLTPEAMRAVRTAEGYGPESVNEVLRAYQIARNPEMDATVRQQATEALGAFWQGFDNRPNWTRPNPQPEQAPQPGTEVVPFGQGMDVAAPGAPSPFDPNTLDGEAQEVGTLPPNRPLLTGPEEVAQQYRRDLLEEVLADPDTRNPLSRYESVLKKNGFEQRRATPDERKLIEDRTVSRTETVPARAELPSFAAVEQSRRAAFPMTQTGAQRQAAERTQATGQAFEVVPHPTVKGRFAVQAVADQFRDATQMVEPVAAANTSPERVAQTPEIEHEQPTNALLNSGEISSEFDVSGRTDEQLRYMSTNGKPGWKESAQAELSRRTQGTANEKTPQALPPTQERGTAQQAEVTQKIAKAEQAGVTLSDADKATIQRLQQEADDLTRKADRLGISDPMNKGNAFPMGVGFTKMTKRKSQAIDSSVRRAGEAVKLYNAAKVKQAQVERMLSGVDTDAHRATQQGKKEQSQRELVTRLMNWKKGDKIGKFTIERVSKDRDGYPTSYTISGDGIVKGVMDKTDIARDFFGGDKEKLRRIVDEARNASAPEPTQTLPQAGQASRPQGTQEGAQEPGQGLKRIPRGEPKSLLELIRRSGGISSKLASDIAGERTAGKKGYPVGVFRSNGMAEDMLAELLQQNGFLSEADINNQDDTSGAGAAMDLVRAALAGERVTSIAEREREMADAEERQYRDTIRQQASEAGIKTAFRKFSDIETEVLTMRDRKAQAEADALEQEDRAAYDELLADVRAVLDDAEIESLIERNLNAPMRDMLGLLTDAYSAKIAEINAELSSARAPRDLNEQDYRDAFERENAASDGQADARAAREGQANGRGAAGNRQTQADGFSLESQTPQDLAARDAAQRETAEREQREQQERERKAQADAERGSFTLSGSDRAADVMAAQGQGGLFDGQSAAPTSPEPRAEQGEQADTGADTATAEQSSEVAGNGRDTFSVSRLNSDTNEFAPTSFERGEYVKAWMSGSAEDGDAKYNEGEIEGISHVNKQAKVNGVWHPFGAIYKAERPAAPQKPTVPLSSVIDRVNAKNGDGLTEADRIATIESHREFMTRLHDGEVKIDEYKARFESVVKSKGALIAELSKMTKDALLSLMSGYRAARYKNDKKQTVVDVAYRDMLDSFVLGESISYGYGEKYEDVIRGYVERETQESLTAYADERKAASAEFEERATKQVEGIQNPQTVEDFDNALRLKKAEGMTFAEARMSLTPEQRATYDRLRGEKSRSDRKARADQQKADVRVAAQTTDGQVIETRHTKTGEPLFVVKSAERVERDIYNHWNATAKRMGGWYSSFRGNGAVPGFQFKTRESADAFLAFLGGDTEQAKTVVQERRDAFADDKSQSAVERLNEMADRLDERADESLGRERKANTERRARFAASAEAAANAEKAMATTMRRIAAAIQDGSAQFLDRVRQKAQIEYLTATLRTAKDREIRAKYPSYAEQERHKGEAPTIETADYAEFPQYTMMRSDLANLARQLVNAPGMKLLGQRILKVADDTSAAYTAFAKANLLAVSRFGRADGSGFATFTTMKDAERSIEASDLSAVAVPVQVKRGEYRIVLSPSEAIKRGVWQGDDRKMTLSPEIGAEIVEKLGKLNRRNAGRDTPKAPWQLENAYNDLKRLAGMGIEAPWEFRAALREFAGLKEAPKERDKIKEMERAMIGRRNDGLDFFPTSGEVVEQMLSAAELEEGMSVLEPSAGMGHIADRIREAGVEPDVVELSNDRKELLEAKGFNVVARDFTEMDRGEGYDRIIMNPPFSDRRDAEHVRHAYTLLRPGGRLVAIMGEGVFFGQDKKATEFRDWLEQVGGTDEKLPEGSFLDPSLPVNTGVNARMVVIDKPEGAQFSRDTSSTGTAPDAIWSAVESLVGPLRRRRIVVVQSADVLVEQGILQSRDANGAQAFVKDGKAYFIAGNIQPGNERAVFLHEVGAHLGMERILSPLQRSVLLNRIKTWAAQANGSFESRIAQAAQRRVEAAGVTGADAESELIAYAVEEAVKAGINPTTDTAGPIGQWFKTLWSALRTALEKLGLVNASKLTAQDIVNLAHGAANVAMSEEVEPLVARQSNAVDSVLSRKPQVSESGMDGLRSNAELLSNLLKSQTFRLHGLGGFDAPAQREVLAAVRSFGFDTQILRSVVDLIPVDVVHILSGKQASAESLLRNEAVLKKLLSADGNGSVSTAVDVADALVSAIAGVSAKFGNEVGSLFNRRSTSGAGKVDEFSAGHNGPSQVVDTASVSQRSSDTGNSGAFSPSDPRIQFSRAAAIPNAEAVSSKARDFLADVVKRPGTFGVLSRTLQTQYHKATKNPQFKAVWTRAHAMFMDASRAMSRPADLAPELLPKFDLSNMGKAAQAVFGRGQVARADIKAVADVLSAGTLAGGPGPMEGVVWSDKQLTEDGVKVGEKFVKLTAQQLKLYKEARAAIDASLDESAAAEAWKLLRRHTMDADLRNWIAQNPQAAPDAVADTLATVIEQETEKLENLQLAAEANPSKAADKAVADQEAVIADLKDTEERTAAIFDKAATLKDAGYMPLMRFGQFRIAVTTQGEKGDKIEYVSRYESAFEANRARRQLMQDFPASEGFTVGAVEVTDQDAWKQFKGVSPETVMLFAKESGIDADEVMQAWYKEAVASRSSLRRMVHRKGYQGFSDDLPRVLASFITSNGKAAGYAYHLADMQQMMQDETMPGDVHREARELLETITQPTEKGANVRGVMASWYLLGSIASAIVNSTQTLTMSLPFLSQFGSKGFAPGEAMGHLSRAYGQAFGKIKDKALADAVKRAEEAGIVDSNEVFHLYAEAMKPMIAKLGSGSVAYRARAFMTLWGAPFAIVEKLNRKSTFIAAYMMAKAQGKTDAQAFDFGERAVTETQGIYAVHNRPNWARGAVGGAILTFRQFSIAYLELASRMWQSGPEGKKAAGLMLGILFLTAGLSGLPGEDDLLDLIDTFSQTFLGKSTVSKMELRNWLNDTLGKELGAFVNSGVSAFLPLDVSGRMGMGNLLPGTALFKPSEPDPKREMLEVLGVPGSFAMSAIEGAKLAMQGEGTAAIKAFAPKAVQDVVKGAEMLRTGEARDLRGRKIVDVGVADAFWQSIGFNPSVKAEAGRRAFEVNEMIGYNKRKESEIVGRLARGVADRDQEVIQSAQQDLVEWNQRNPETPILINRRQVQQRIMQLQMERSGRIVKMAPPELRRRVSEALEEE